MLYRISPSIVLFSYSADGCKSVLLNQLVKVSQPDSLFRSGQGSQGPAGLSALKLKLNHCTEATKPTEPEFKFLRMRIESC